MNLGGAIKINKCAVVTLVFALCFIIYVLYFTTSSSIEFPKKDTNKINLRKLMISLILAAKSGGKQVLDIAKEADFGGIHTKGKTKEGVNDYLTQADVNSHCSIAYSLWHLFPDLNLISEEDVQEKNCPKELQQSFDIDPSILEGISLPDIYISNEELGPLWIDPLDATKEYTEKLFKYVSVMICATDKMGDPFMGVVYFPFEDKVYWGWKNQGVSENLRNVKADLNKNVQNPIAIVSLSHAGEVKELVKTLLGEKVSVIQAAGSGYKIVNVLQGNASIYLHNTRIKKWDLCAGNALISSVGGTMVTLKREKISYSSDTNPIIEDGLLVEINKNVMN